MILSNELALHIAHFCEDKLASDILILEIGQVSHITDYFVIMHASNRVQTATLADAIRDELEEKYGLHLPHIEGQGLGDWLLLDYGIVVVHVFLAETRRFYDLERLWVDAPILQWQE